MGIRTNTRQLVNSKMVMEKHKINVSDYTLPETDEELLDECKIQVFRSSGPGGQSVNTTDSAVRLLHIPTNIVITNQDERSQLLNKKRAVAKLRTRITELQFVPKERKETKVSTTAKERRLKEKRELGGKKQQRSKLIDFED